MGDIYILTAICGWAAGLTKAFTFIPQVIAYYKLAVLLQRETNYLATPSSPRTISERQRNIYTRAKGTSSGLYYLNNLSCLLFMCYACIPLIDTGSLVLLPVLVTNAVAFSAGLLTFVYQRRILRLTSHFLWHIDTWVDPGHHLAHGHRSDCVCSGPVCLYRNPTRDSHIP